MRKNILAMSIAAMVGGLGMVSAAVAGVSMPGTGPGTVATPTTVGTQLTATTATNLSITPDGIGHILLVPYFTTQNGNSTLISIVNTDTVNGKAVKVRFRGAANSDDIFDFQILMSPGDVWTANVSQDASGLSKLTTTDKSCTLPSVVNANFVVNRLPAVTATFTAAQQAEQTREGYVEIFNMADIPPTLVANLGDTTGTVVNPLFTAIKHVSGVPAGCGSAAVNALGTDVTSETNAIARGFNTPTTGLAGGWTIVNFAGAAVAWSDKDTAIVANQGVGTVAARGRLVFSPQKSDPVSAAVINTLTNDPLFRVTTAGAGSAKIAAANYDLPDLSTPYVTAVATAAVDATSPSTQANNIGSTIAVKSVVNEFLTDASISAKTDWVFSSPTRRYAVAMDYSATNFAALFSTSVFDLTTSSSNAAVSLFYTSANTAKGTVAGTTGLICVQPSQTSTTIATYDREETTAGTQFVISPGTTAKLEFCGETNVLSFNSVGTASVLGATIARKDIDVGYNAGWSSIPSSGLGNGLPLLGNAFVKAAGSAVSNFSITHGHRFTR